MSVLSLDAALAMTEDERLALLGRTVVASSVPDPADELGLVRRFDEEETKRTLVDVGRSFFFAVSRRLHAQICLGTDEQLSRRLADARNAGTVALAAFFLDLLVGLGVPVVTATLLAASIAAALVGAAVDQVCEAWANFNG